jgi:hypothetical protein
MGQDLSNADSQRVLISAEVLAPQDDARQFRWIFNR